MNLETLLSLTKIQAENSNHHQKIGVVIFKGKKILSLGFNQVNRHTKKIKRSGLKWDGTIHAEQHAIISAKCSLDGASIIVVRYNKKGEMSMAKPCEVCSPLIANVGIKKVYFSNDKGLIENYRVKKLK